MTLALAGGSFVFLAFVVALILAAAFTLYGRRGSGIDAHPLPGDAEPGSGHESGQQDPDATEFRQTFDDRGGR